MSAAMSLPDVLKGLGNLHNLIREEAGESQVAERPEKGTLLLREIHRCPTFR